MADFLGRLAERALGRASVVQPLVVSEARMGPIAHVSLDEARHPAEEASETDVSPQPTGSRSRRPRVRTSISQLGDDGPGLAAGGSARGSQMPDPVKSKVGPVEPLSMNDSKTRTRATSRDALEVPERGESTGADEPAPARERVVAADLRPRTPRQKREEPGKSARYPLEVREVAPLATSAARPPRSSASSPLRLQPRQDPRSAGQGDAHLNERQSIEPVSGPFRSAKASDGERTPMSTPTEGPPRVLGGPDPVAAVDGPIAWSPPLSAPDVPDVEPPETSPGPAPLHAATPGARTALMAGSEAAGRLPPAIPLRSEIAESVQADGQSESSAALVAPAGARGPSSLARRGNDVISSQVPRRQRLIRVSIGRVEIRADMEPPLPALPAPPDAEPPLPAVSLDEYLRRRTEGAT